MKRWHLRGLGIVALAHGASDFYSGMVPLLIFTVVAARGLSPVYQGAIGFLWYFTSSIVQPLFGYYSDKRGRWWFLPASVALTVTAVSLAGLAPSIALLAVLVVAGGLGSAIMHPEAGKYAAMLSGSRKSGGISIFQIGGGLGYALGPVAIAAALHADGPRGSLWMVIPGAFAVAAILIPMRGVDRDAAEHHRATSAGLPPALGNVDRFGVTLLVGSTALKYLVSAAFMTFLPNLIVARGGSLVQAGELVTAFLAVGVIGLFAGGYLGDRFGALTIAVASLLASVPLLFGFFVFQSWLGIACMLLANVMLNVQSAPSVVIVQRMLPRNLGMALGLMNGVAFGIGSALVAAVGFVVARSGASSALLQVSALPAACAIAYWMVGRRMNGGQGNAVPRRA
ncbi:MAG: MFS transporter [Candidatus Eremiobacteraeota bacterium]|nr:MFS transporter [Candidatus Eremiobacteraeota bacterium]